MVNNKRKLSLEEQEFLRAEWRKQHPEEAARRDAKRKLAKEEKAKLLREKEDFEQENLVSPFNYIKPIVVHNYTSINLG